MVTRWDRCRWHFAAADIWEEDVGTETEEERAVETGLGKHSR